jgi:hypothetical protein
LSVSKAPGWPWANARIGLQYTWYNKFDGTTAGASDHNTLFLHLRRAGVSPLTAAEEIGFTKHYC